LILIASSYNQKAHPIPFMKTSNVGVGPRKTAKDVPDLEEAIEEDDDGEVLEAADAVEDEDDIKGDKYIKQPKAKAKKTAKKAKTAEVDDDDDEEKPKGKARSKAGPKSKAKK
jgi:replication factor C subunit 1